MLKKWKGKLDELLEERGMSRAKYVRDAVNHSVYPTVWIVSVKVGEIVLCTVEQEGLVKAVEDHAAQQAYAVLKAGKGDPPVMSLMTLAGQKLRETMSYTLPPEHPIHGLIWEQVVTSPDEAYLPPHSLQALRTLVAGGSDNTIMLELNGTQLRRMRALCQKLRLSHVKVPTVMRRGEKKNKHEKLQITKGNDWRWEYGPYDDTYDKHQEEKRAKKQRNRFKRDQRETLWHVRHKFGAEGFDSPEDYLAANPWIEETYGQI